MDTIKQLEEELTQEYQTTKNFFESFPEGKNEYAPHEKSMKMMPLATHIAEVFGWPEFILKTEVLDFGKGDYKPSVLHTKDDLVKKLDEDYEKGIASLKATTEEELNKEWRMEHNGHVLAKWSKYGAIRHGLSQAIHHRAQLGVYYRLNDIKLPNSYGPTADDQSF